MRKERHQPVVTALLVMTLSLIFLTHCGYGLHRHAQLPFEEIQVGEIENRTYEPKLQDILNRALTDELQKQGIQVRPSARFVLSGSVKSFSMVGVAEKGDIITEYQMHILADFTLKDKQGTAKEFRNIAPPFIVNVTGSGNFGTLLANKEIAEEQAMKDLASQIVGMLMYP